MCSLHGERRMIPIQCLCVFPLGSLLNVNGKCMNFPLEFLSKSVFNVCVVSEGDVCDFPFKVCIRSIGISDYGLEAAIGVLKMYLCIHCARVCVCVLFVTYIGLEAARGLLLGKYSISNCRCLPKLAKWFSNLYLKISCLIIRHRPCRRVQKLWIKSCWWVLEYKKDLLIVIL